MEVVSGDDESGIFPELAYPSLVSGFQNPDRLKWAPNSERIAFSAILNGDPGTWIVENPSGQLMRVWPKQERFSWSPDGTRIALYESAAIGDWTTIPEPIIIEVPPAALLTGKTP